MLLFRGVGVAFVHVPKTCGTALRKFLSSAVGGADDFWGIEKTDPGSPEGRRFDAVDRAHYTVEMVRELHGGLWEEMLGMRVFSVAREPYGRAISAYRQAQSHFGRDRFFGFMDYMRCVEDEMYRTERDGHLYIHGVPQVKFHMFVRRKPLLFRRKSFAPPRGKIL